MRQVLHHLQASRRLFVSATPFRNARIEEINAIFTFFRVPHEYLPHGADDEPRRCAINLTCSVRFVY